MPRAAWLALAGPLSGILAAAAWGLASAAVLAAGLCIELDCLFWQVPLALAAGAGFAYGWGQAMRSHGEAWAPLAGGFVAVLGLAAAQATHDGYPAWKYLAETVPGAAAAGIVVAAGAGLMAWLRRARAKETSAAD